MVHAVQVSTLMKTDVFEEVFPEYGRKDRTEDLTREQGL